MVGVHFAEIWRQMRLNPRSSEPFSANFTTFAEVFNPSFTQIII